MSNQKDYETSPHPITRTNSQSNLFHTIKRNIGSSTTSLTAFALSHQNQQQQQQHNHHFNKMGPASVSLSPFEYASPVSSHAHINSYFNGHHNSDDKVNNHLSKSSGLANMDTLDSEDLDFDTAYNMINESIDQFSKSDHHQQQQQPRTPEQHFGSLQYKSPNTLSQQKFYQDNDQLYQDHRKAIIQAGLQASSPGQHSPFQVSPHTRNLLNSVNNMASSYQMSNSGYELLSITESSALEKFLDSVVDDSKLSDLGRHWPSIDPLAKTESEYMLPSLVSDDKTRSSMNSTSSIPDLRLQKINANISSGLHPIPSSHAISLSYSLSPSPGPQDQFYRSESSLTPPVLIARAEDPVKKKRGRKKKSETEAITKKPKLESSSSESGDLSRARRQTLSEEQKKMNHTESEKKRRAMIKLSYDKLLETIEADKCYHIKFSKQDEKEKKKISKRGNSRFAVMTCVITEIEWLLKRNEELRSRLQESS